MNGSCSDTTVCTISLRLTFPVMIQLPIFRSQHISPARKSILVVRITNSTRQLSEKGDSLRQGDVNVHLVATYGSTVDCAETVVSRLDLE